MESMCTCCSSRFVNNKSSKALRGTLLEKQNSTIGARFCFKLNWGVSYS